MRKKPCVYEVATGRAIIPDDTLFPHPYDIYGPEWSRDGHTVIFEYNERGKGLSCFGNQCRDR